MNPQVSEGMQPRPCARYEAIENALYAFIGIGRAEIIHELVYALNSVGDKTMVEAYLNCGNTELSNAARDWATRRGYPIMPGSGSAPVGWGSW